MSLLIDSISKPTKDLSVTVSSSTVPEDFEPESIVDRRLRNGKVEYFIKWKGYNSEDCTWEKVSLLTSASFSALIAQFESQPEQQKEARVQKRKEEAEKEVRGFARGLVAEKILGSCVNQDGEKKYLVKWKGVEAADLVSFKEANEKCPAAVISHLESNLDYCDECSVEGLCSKCSDEK